jgi:hypothetical protein
MQPKKYTILNAVTADTTSGGIPVNNAKRLSIQFIASAISAGNGIFTVEVSNDGVNWLAYNRLTTNVTNTNAQTDARVASVTLSSNTSAFVFFPPGDTFAFFRVKVDMTTDGAYSAIAYVD